MTPEQLDAFVHRLAPGHPWPDVHDADALLRAVEGLADEAPEDRRLVGLVRAVLAYATAPRGVPSQIGGVIPEQLVRWDDWTTTWIGRNPEAGTPAMVRLLRPHAISEPVLRRQLAREYRAVRRVLPAVRLEEGVHPALIAPVSGTALEPATTPMSPDATARLLMSGLFGLEKWSAQGLGLPDLTQEEIRDTGSGLELVCLSPAPRGSIADAVAQIARALSPHPQWVSGALDEAAKALSEAPPDDVDTAVAWVRRAMATELSARRHDLARRHARSAHLDRVARLHTLLLRLGRAVPAPAGRGAVGVDLDGNITVVSSERGVVWWGPDDQPARVYDPDQGFDAPTARRLLRAHAHAPTNTRLQEAVHGEAEAVDQICQWVALGLKARTARLLLEQRLP